MNSNVNFEIAKLLKEKGFNIEIDYGLNQILNLKPAPTIAEVIMWLYEKHGIWIEVRHIKTFNVNRFHVIIWNYKDTSDYITIHCENGVGYEVWDSPTEAYEAAIEYTLKNLI